MTSAHTHPLPHPAHPSSGDVALAYAAAAAAATAAAWITLQALQVASHSDLRGAIEPLLLFSRIGVVTTPLFVALRVASHAALVWLALTALGERPRFRTVFFRLLLLAPILEVPAALDALSLLLRDLPTFQAAHIPIGLDLAFPGHTGRAALLLYGINAATTTWLATLWWTLRHPLGHSRLAATCAALLAFSAVVLLPLLTT